jgi:hypothetical protein
MVRSFIPASSPLVVAGTENLPAGG